MGGTGSKCCQPETEHKQFSPPPPSPPPPPQLTPLKEGQLYVSSLPQVLNMSREKLDATYMPLSRTFGKNSLILPVGKDFQPRLFVRFFLIYSFYIKKYTDGDAAKKKEYQEIFYKLASQTHKDPLELANLEQFKKEYRSQTNSLKQQLVVVKYIFNSKFIIQNLNQILLSSDSPNDIAHLIFPLASAFNAIKKNYRETRSGEQQPIYIVTALEAEEMELIKKMYGKPCCFYFSTFMKGFTNQNAAKHHFTKLKKQYKNTKPIMKLVVNFPKIQQKWDKSIDNGYYIDKNAKEGEANVLFNIMNSFKVSNNFDNQYDLQYGFLPTITHLNSDDRLKLPQNLPLLRVIDVCNAISKHYLKSQSCLFRIIKEGEESMKVSQSFSQQNTQVSQQNYTKLPQVQAENVINNYIDRQDYDQAMMLAKQYGSSNLMKAKQAVILYKQQQYQKAQHILNTIPRIKSNQINQATEIAQFIEAKILLHNQLRQDGINKLRALIDLMKIKYLNQFEIIAIQVLSVLEGAYGKEITIDQKERKRLSQSQAQNKSTISQSALNIRGIATSI